MGINYKKSTDTLGLIATLSDSEGDIKSFRIYSVPNSSGSFEFYELIDVPNPFPHPREGFLRRFSRYLANQDSIPNSLKIKISERITDEDAAKKRLEQLAKKRTENYFSSLTETIGNVVQEDGERDPVFA